MASVINASTSLGLQHSADTSGILKLQTASTDAVTIDASQNVGIGVTPSAWGSLWKTLQFQNGFVGAQSGTGAILGTNHYNDGSVYRYTANGYAMQYQQALSTGEHFWRIAASGTAGNAISFTQAMTLDVSGNLNIGMTGGTARLTVASSANTGELRVQGSSTNSFYGALYKDNVSGEFRITQADGGSGMTFFTGVTPAERMRLDSSGNLLVGTTSFTGTNNGVQITSAGLIYVGRPATNTAMAFYNTTTGTQVGAIVVNSTTTSYNTSSDYRLKNTIAPMTGALTKVALLKPVTYKWNEDGSDGEGFIAHELAEVCPHAVTGEKDAVDDDGNPKYQGIDVSFLVATLTAAIQEQQAIIQQLQADVAALKGN